MDFQGAKEKASSIFKKILLLIGIVLLAVGALFTFGNYSEGDRAGTLIKLSTKGYVIKTHEGQLNLGMVYVEGSESSVNKSLWSFSVRGDKELLERMNYAMLNGKRVKLHYEEKYYTMPWVGETNYIVKSMEIEEKK